MVQDSSASSRVLVVEDSPTQALQIRALLEGHGLQVTHALSGEIALERLNSELPDLVIVDYHLPGMNGDELVRQIRANITTRALPVLMLTQDSARGSERQGLESGADVYIPKSSDSEMLLLRINALLRRRAGRGADLRTFTEFRPARFLAVHGAGGLDSRLSRLLTEERYTLTSATSLPAAQAAVASGVDCVLVDMTAAELDGAAVCRVLDAQRASLGSEDAESAHVQIVALVPGSSDRTAVTRAYAAGADDILSLGADDDLLKLRLRTLVRRNAARRENQRIERELREQQVALAQAAAKAAEADAARMAELLEGERRFRMIFDTGYQLIWLLDLDGEIIVANRTALETTGEGADDVSGRKLWETAWWRDAPAEAAALQRQFSRALENRFVRFEAGLRERNGSWRVFDLSLRPALGADGRLLQVVAEAHDITEFKDTEAALRQSQKMEAIGQITGGVAHDFNNLLMAVLANLELLRKRLPEGAGLNRYIDGAMQGANRGVSLTQRLLAFARKQDLQSEAVDIAALLRNMENLLERSAGPGIRLRYDVAPRMAPAQADPNQLELAILNLIVNARDAMPSGGEIVVEAHERRLDRPDRELASGRYVCIRVIDTGTGMDEDTVQRAIEPFFSTKETGKGTGLGLSMVHGMAMQLGGGLRLQSAQGKGTTVEIWLPIAVAAAAAATAEGGAATAAPATDRKATILVLDDDALISMSMVDMLEDLGHTVIEANTPQKALEIIGSKAALDLLITDYAMPQMNGGELAVAAKKLRPDLPILLATGYADIPSGIHVDLPRISKPYDQASLADQIAVLLEAKRGAEAKG
jgi:PAS domain S-box-containing protein